MEKPTVSFNINFLRESAISLAKTLKVVPASDSPRSIKPVLEDSKRVLTETYRALSKIVKSEGEISSASRWLMDNFYVIQEQIVQIVADFPRSYQKTIPILAEGEYKGYPRVYEIVRNIFTHTDNVLDNEVLSEYIRRYQKVEALQLGELWAVPIMIRLFLIQILAEKAARILSQIHIKSEVDQFVAEIDRENLKEPGAFSHAISNWVKDHSETSGLPYLLELYGQLNSRGLLQEEQKRWFVYRANQYEVNLDDAIRIEAQKQSRLQVNVQNAVVSLREITETDWSDFVEETSAIERILVQDPAGFYVRMDFQTRDRYRKTVERLSRRSALSEPEVSMTALNMAKAKAAEFPAHAQEPLDDHHSAKRHIGYFLIGDGYDEMTAKINYSPPLRERLNRLVEKHFYFYLVAIFCATLLLTGLLLIFTDAISASLTVATIMAAVAFFPALDLSITLVNRFFSFFLPPRVLPKMSFKGKIPHESRTVVVIPTLITSGEDAMQQIEKLEIHALANPDDSLQFGLLTDFTDASEKSLEGDQAMLESARKAIDKLNKRYSSAYGEKFFLLHRERLWNQKENAWMGWERKRGKLEEFNALICDQDAKTSYAFSAGDFLNSIASTPVRFVITLDADTKLPPDSAKKLISTLAHPLNRARYDRKKGRITKGYTIIQPRISFTPDSARTTWFSKIFSGNVGIDPYSAAVSDIYQDLSGEAIFTGKGIYDVHAFHRVLHNRLPENRILSHDLLESAYVRAGLATDIELFDDYPSTYFSFTRRNHRWARGDWQIINWLFPKVPGKDGVVPNPINLLSKWKILDNLRRSLNYIFLIIFFVAGLFWLPGPWWAWMGAAFGILAFPIYESLSSDLLNRPARVRWKLYMDKVQDNLKINTVQALSTVIILPHQAYNKLHAIGTALYRMSVSGKNLLEWTTASHVEKIAPNSLRSYFRIMIFPVLLGISIFIIALGIAPEYLWIIAPFSLLWAGSPIYVWLLSQPIKGKPEAITEQERLKLRTYARRTWFYFERFVNDQYSWLPPDNYQEDPPLPLVEKTSPTNMGLGLVANQTAYHMGYITLGELLERQEKSLAAIDALDTYHGHFFNWYDTKTGKVLNPRYISTVDSGNLAASLIVTKEAIKQVMRPGGSQENSAAGLEDTLLTVRDIFDEFRSNELLSEQSAKGILSHVTSMLDKLNAAPSGASQAERLKAVREDAAKLRETELVTAADLVDERMLEILQRWIESPSKLIEKALAEYESLSLPDADAGAGSLREKWKKQAKRIQSFAERMVREMNFTFLYQKKRGLFSIGYNLDTAQFDKSTYDLLASESRIASYVAIAKGDVPVEHWFRLSRRLTSINNEETLLSWGGTMFEYLMPMLFMRSYPNSIMSHTNQNVVHWQKEYGDKKELPWGYSESAYYYLNIDMHFQYRTFGVPGLGLKRGLADDYVVAPYASMLALMVATKVSIENLEEIEKLGGLGVLGFYNAIDFTPSHLLDEETYKIVKTYMVHHHGMSLVALDNYLNGWKINNYFHADSSIRSCELILQERIPKGEPIKEPHPIDAELEPAEKTAMDNIAEHQGMDHLDLSPPRLHTLSNGRFSAMVTHAGTGYSSSGGVVLNAWKPDPTLDPLGFFFYIKDIESGQFWSAMHQPVKRKPDRYDSWFHNGKVVCSRVDDWIETTTEICVSMDHQIEIRKLRLTNYEDRERTLEVTSYAEVVLNRLVDHNAHPAFSKLFIETEYLPEQAALIAKRRPRSSSDQPVWLVHTFACNRQDTGSNPLYFETERSAFIGKGRSLSNPRAMDPGNRFEGSQGQVSDPIVSFRKQIKIKPGENTQLSFGLGFAASREEAIQLAEIYNSQQAVNRAFDLASMYGSVELNHLAITSRQAHYFQKLSSYIYYANPAFRTSQHLLQLNYKKQHDLWPYGISGDLPLIIFRVNDANQLKKMRHLFKAHTFWRMRGLESELLIINEHAPGYIDEVQNAIQLAIESSLEREVLHRRGGVFTYRADKIQEDDLTLLLSVAHAVFDHKLPDFSSGTDPVPTRSWRLMEEETTGLLLQETGRNPDASSDALYEERKQQLQFFNGYGGFAADGREYHILIKKDAETGHYLFPPAPWINVIANPAFGFTVSERGAGHTWSENSRENKLTSWSNDPVTDLHSEAFYIRDEITKAYWSPTPGPVVGAGFYQVIHGFGYTRFEFTSNNLKQQLTQFVPESDALKVSKLTLKNTGNEVQTLSVFRYLDQVLGVERTVSSRFIIQKASASGNTVYSTNNYNNEFAGRTVFASLINPLATAEFGFTTDREQFIGRNRTLTDPLAIISQENLENTLQIGGDPCAAIQTRFELNPGQEVSLLFLEGESPTKTEADQVIQHYSDIAYADSQLRAVQAFWERTLTRIQVETPDPSLDVMMNGWLMYQNLSCRIWARSAFYQSGGAFGFRDQLQDVAAALYTDPELCRKQILLHAQNQFIEGDVLHWWHPPTGRGIRSRITDDRLWLPYLTAFYLQSTHDETILKEQVPYIFARKLEAFEHEAYLQPALLPEKGTLYEHCCKAIEISLQFGANGLPLIGGGDWNDGMNRVGEQGKGESVWLGFFLYDILIRFDRVCRAMEDVARAERYQSLAAELKENLNKNGWDGAWYLRAFYDDGTPLGSSQNEECRIDAISQAWSVISGVAPLERSRQALQAAEEHLISPEDQLIRLLAPPFDKTEKDPGYIKGYIPGVRENGGQYTHGALWIVKAFAEAGLGDQAVQYLNMINPVNHALTRIAANKYKVEPFVISADIYGEAPLTGQGGWSWYTGSAGWMYRVALESVLGLQYDGDEIVLAPVISRHWSGFRIRLILDDGETIYHLKIENPEGLQSGHLEGVIDDEKVAFENSPARIPLNKDKAEHRVALVIRS